MLRTNSVVVSPLDADVCGPERPGRLGRAVVGVVQGGVEFVQISERLSDVEESIQQLAGVARHDRPDVRRRLTVWAVSAFEGEYGSVPHQRQRRGFIRRRRRVAQRKIEQVCPAVGLYPDLVDRQRRRQRAVVTGGPQFVGQFFQDRPRLGPRERRAGGDHVGERPAGRREKRVPAGGGFCPRRRVTPGQPSRSRRPDDAAAGGR